MDISKNRAMREELINKLAWDSYQRGERKKVAGYKEGRYEAFTRCIAIVTALGRVGSTGLADTFEVIRRMEKERDE